MTLRRTLILAALSFAAASAASAQEADPRRLRIALLPDENAATIIQNAQPLRRHLERTLERDVEIVVTTDYSSMIEAMRFGRIHIGYFGGFSYILAKSRAPQIEPFAVGIERGSPTYRSILIASAAGPVQSLEDVRGRPFAFGDPASTSSHLVPRAFLQTRVGLVGDRDYRVVHLGTHDGVARAVQAGQVPAGALSEAIFRNLVARGTVEEAKVRVLAFSDPIPNYPLVMQGNLAAPLKGAIRQVFLELKDPELLKSFRVEGFAPVDDSAYDVLRETARILNLDLARQ
ncbi:MAG: phosphate/phosphite/phosphonate ABC transporter substrate-binding protein [Elioraea sp.]|nr:phosphate/phosphite/phosphonate ABC transporter substrate-binding protein [Elioraea sp.]MDW8443286.1 phosphate/phosphite/phosphonate ABC transporter substrate-binding protein [Acetobacteraceae bacterium]